jgi:DNA invertase Pin-like site-specific DNA recombinase
MYTKPWFEKNNVELIDTFIDAGYTARTFDRPDMNKLLEFIKQYHKMVDYLVVSEFDRFSRDAGEALSLIKKLQLKYNVQIVSVIEGITFDYRDNSSFFRAGLSVLLGEEDNIRRINKINSGIYQAKAREGRYIHGHPPYGYRKEGEGKSRHLVVYEDEAKIIRYMFDAYLHNTPLYIIEQRIKEMGCKFTSNFFVQKMLNNPVYSGQQLVKSWRDLPGGLFPALHTAIIDMLTWQQVQDKLHGTPHIRVSISDEMPLRGVLHCHCGKLLTGAPSRSRSGKYFYYYKCSTTSKHNNISVIHAHKQLDEMLQYLSLPERLVNAIKDQSDGMFEQRMRENKKLAIQKKQELEKLEIQLHNIEEKWINNQMPFESYNRWLNDLTQQRIQLTAQIEKLKQDKTQSRFILLNNLDRLTDMKYVYQSGNTLQKQELIRLVFDNSLAYREGVYRTTYLMPVFSIRSKSRGKEILDARSQRRHTV